MVRTQIYLTQEQQRRLERLAAATGRRKSELFVKLLMIISPAGSLGIGRRRYVHAMACGRTVMTSTTLSRT